MNEQQLIELNKILAQINPLIGMVDITARAVVKIFQNFGKKDDALEFEDAIGKFRRNMSELSISIEEFKSKHGNG